MTELYVALGGYTAFLTLVIVLAYWRSRKWTEEPLRGLALPKGSVRSVLAFAVIGAFVVFIFFGEDVVADENYDAVLTSLGTLTGAVTGFYFGGRSSQQPPTQGTSSGAIPPSTGSG